MGFISTMAKHSKMDRAKQNMEQAKYDLRNFSRELNDVNIACHLDIETAIKVFLLFGRGFAWAVIYGIFVNDCPFLLFQLFFFCI